jgi:predicted ATP-grasp superfamily ATP-dependent carboligase
MSLNDIFVSGASPQTYFVFRLISKINPDVNLLTTEKKCCFYSNVGKKTLIEDYESYISYLINNIGDNTIFVCGGKDIQALSEFEPNFFKRVNVFPNDIYGLAYFTDKRKTYQLCEVLGLPIIYTWSLDSEIPVFSTPHKMIAKWNVENISNVLVDFKTRIFSTNLELENFKATVPPEVRSKIIVQKFIESKPGSNISFLGLYAEGELLAGMLAQQLEQYPQGITSYLKEYDGPLSEQLVEAAKKLISKTKFNGFCEVEYKIDSMFENFYVLEVNPRPCGWSSALLGKYSNLEELLLDPSVKPIIRRKKVSWINILRFLRGRFAMGLLPFIRGIFSVPFVSSYDIFNIYDIKPFLSQFLQKKKS